MVCKPFQYGKSLNVFHLSLFTDKPRTAYPLVLHFLVVVLNQHTDLGICQLRAIDILEDPRIALVLSEVAQWKVPQIAMFTDHQHGHFVAIVPVYTELHTIQRIVMLLFVTLQCQSIALAAQIKELLAYK